jgi:T-complex protein 1 subunit eta
MIQSTPPPKWIGLIGSKFRELLEKCAATAMSSKLIHSHETFFVKMVVDAVLTLDQEDLDEKLIGIKKIPGGAMQVDP